MTELLDHLMTLAFLAVWIMIASELVSRYGRESRLGLRLDSSKARSRRY